MQTAWAILPDLLAHLDARADLGIHQTPAPYRINADGIAVVPLKGVLSKAPTVLSALFGGTTYGAFMQNMLSAAADPAAHAILLDVDSPGGQVDGVQQAAQAVAAARAHKPVMAHADGVVASAAYWIASAAQSLHLASNTTGAGSIGVLATHVDISGLEERAGVRRTEIVAGKFKASGSPHRPLSAEGREVLQAQVDYLYGLFVADVAAHRRINQATALKMADGRVYMGTQAVSAGLVDGIADRGHVLAMLAGKKSPAAPGAFDLGTAAQAYAARHRIDPLTALHEVKQVAARIPKGYTADPARLALAERARAYALDHRVSLAEALRAIGG